jgi:hypothetical protein
MDKKLAAEFVKRVGPLEHSENVQDRKAARKAESKLRKLNKSIPKKRIPSWD